MERLSWCNNQYEMTTPVVVVGGSHHNTLGVIRSLGAKGLSPILITVTKENKPYIAYSKYVCEDYIAQDAEDALVIIREIGSRLSSGKAVLIACTDGMASIIDDNNDELQKFFFVPGIGGGRLTKLQNKGIMTDLAMETGFCVPSSLTCNTDLSAIDIPLPWIIKPLWSKMGKKTDIKRIYSSKDWDIYRKADHFRDVQVQQLIEKEFEYQLIGLSLDDGEEVIIPGYSYVIRPAETTNTGFLRYSALESSFSGILETSKKFLLAAGYSGLFSLEFLRGKDGKDYFMEINFRNDGNAICVTSAGVNLPFVWYLYCTLQDYKGYLKSTQIKTVYVMPEIEDLGQLKHRKVGIMQWLKDFAKTDTFMEFSRKDPWPFIHLLLRRIGISRKNG